MTKTPSPSDAAGEITPEMDRRNGLIFIWSQLLIYFSAPVIYIGVVQAAYCDKLGASATIANLPFSAYLLGSISPFFCAWLFSPRRDKALVEYSFYVLGFSIFLVCLSIFLPLANGVRIVVVVSQGLLAGFATNIGNIYTFKCLSRGTTEIGRSRTLKFAFGFGPIAAVLGSLTAQYLLSEKVPGLHYPNNLGLIYLVGAPCMIICGVLTARFQLLPALAEDRQSFASYLWQSLRDFTLDRRLALVWLSYIAWYFTYDSMTNLSLYTREAVGRAPMELSGLIMALRFGTKALAGFALGSLAVRYGARRPMIATVILVGTAITWPFFATGYGYLIAFGLMGAGELGGVYFNNYIISISSPATTTRNLAFMALASPLSGLAPPIYGSITDHFGFHASFLFGIGAAIVSLGLIMLARSRRTDLA